jgi:hypothetical protein
MLDWKQAYTARACRITPALQKPNGKHQVRAKASGKRDRPP